MPCGLSGTPPSRVHEDDVMPPRRILPPELADRPFSVGEAMAAGLGRKRLRGHDLSAPFYGVRSSQTPRSALALCEAYLPRMHAGQYFSHVSAALLYGIPLPRICEQRASVDVSVSAPAHPPRTRGVIGHRLASDTAVRLLRGHRLAAPVETWLQLGTVLQLDDMIIAGDFLVRRKRPLATIEELRAATRVGGRPGIQVARRALKDVRQGTDSPMETITRLILVRAGLPEPMVGYTVHDGAGDFVATPDLAYVAQKVAIEYQGAVHWSSPRIIREDIARREALERAGWQVILVVAEDLGVRSPLLVRRVRLALARD